MSLERTKVALLAEDDYEDHALWYPRYRLLEEGASVDVIGTGGASYHSRHDYEVTADYTVDHAVAGNYSAVVVPSGYAVDRMRLHRPMIHFVERLHDDGAVCAAIGHGAWLFASAGILEGRTCTAVRSIREDLENAGGEWADRAVVRDGRVITSRDREDLPAFASTLVAQLREGS